MSINMKIIRKGLYNIYKEKRNKKVKNNIQKVVNRLIMNRLIMNRVVLKRVEVNMNRKWKKYRIRVILMNLWQMDLRYSVIIILVDCVCLHNLKVLRLKTYKYFHKIFSRSYIRVMTNYFNSSSKEWPVSRSNTNCMEMNNCIVVWLFVTWIIRKWLNSESE